MDQESCVSSWVTYLCFFVTLVAVLEKELPLFDFENWKFVAQAHLVTTGLVKNLSLIFFVIAMPQVGKSRKSSSEGAFSQKETSLVP